MRTIYAHVDVLRRAGFDAYVLHGRPRELPNWFASDAPIRRLGDGVDFDRRDVVVIPEDLPSALEFFASTPLRRMIFCQNHFYAAESLAQLHDWHRFGVERVICASETIRAFVAAECGYADSDIVPYAIDTTLFRARAKIRRIAYMPRKRPTDANVIRYLFRRRYPQYSDFEFAAIENKSENEVAEIVGPASIFLSLGRLEGFGLPPVEAMAADALVVGFDGGCRDYASADNGIWCAGIDECVDGLGRAAGWSSTNAPPWQSLIAGGRETVRRYSIERRDAALFGFWSRTLPSAPT
jgi:hypothetical protein